MENIKKLGFKRNARDFACIRNKEGKIIIGGKIIRYAHLSKLKENEKNVLLREYNLKKVIDLRAVSEKEAKPETIIEGVKYLEIPYFNESTLGMTGGMGSDVLSAIKQAKSKEELYNYIPELTDIYPLLATDKFSSSQISKCIKEIINNRDGAVLFHCTAGKDRTGVTAAILLKLLNVDDDVIYEDYETTNTVSSKNADKYSKLALVFLRDKKLADKVKRVYLAEKQSLKLFFEAVNNEYGNFDNYIYNVLNIDEQEIAEFRNYMLK